MTSAIDLLNPFSWLRAPLSGDVIQRIATSWFSPSMTVNFAGDAAIEGKVVTEVASYGRQIGWLNEIVAALATGKPVPAETLAKLQAAMAEIEALKKEAAGDAETMADAALDRLAAQDEAAFARLVRRRARALPAGASKTTAD